MKDKTTFELATRYNEIIVEMNKLNLEFNKIVKELQTRYLNLKDSPDFQPKKLIKTKEE